MSEEVKDDIEITDNNDIEEKDENKEGDLNWKEKIEQEISELKNLFKTSQTKPETDPGKVEIPIPKAPQKEPEEIPPEETPIEENPKPKKKGFLDWLL